MRQERLLFGKKKKKKKNVWCVNRDSLQVQAPVGRNVPQLIGETNIVASGMPESDIKTICKKCVTRQNEVVFTLKYLAANNTLFEYSFIHIL